MSKICAIIPAAGQGLRMGGSVAKQFMLLDGKPILAHTLAVFEECGEVDAVVLVVAERETAAVREQFMGRFAIVRAVVAGGAQRQDSVYNGFQALDPDTEIVVVHDGVRPFITPQMIRDTVASARDCGAAITAVPVSDTIKRVSSDHFVEQTVDRRDLWRVQTPQAFRYPLLREAFARAFAESFYGTDEGALMEFSGQRVRVIGGSEMNIKITRPEDLILGESIIAARREASASRTLRR
jgi:2-C-methyl-D-erythritol 4-phosphate cytidylyltransferase